MTNSKLARVPRLLLLRVTRWQERASNMVEFAFILPILLFLLSVLVDFGRFIAHKQTAVQLTREVGMMAYRRIDSASAPDFPLTLSTAIENARPVDIVQNGRIYLAQLMIEPDGTARIMQYDQRGTLDVLPRVLLPRPGVGSPLGQRVELPAHVATQPYQTLYVVEIFLRFRPVMPLSTLVGLGGTPLSTNVGTIIYDAAYF